MSGSLPKSVKVGASRVPILPLDPEKARSEGIWGLFSAELNVIFVLKGRPPQMQAEVVLHEVMHALLHDAGLDFEGDDEERLVKTLTPRLAAFLVDNKSAVARLTELLA